MSEKEEDKQQQNVASEVEDKEQQTADAAEAQTKATAKADQATVDDKPAEETVDVPDSDAQPVDNAAADNADSAKLAELQAKIDKMHNDYLLLYADFQNYKKRTLKEKSDLIKSAGESIFVNMLPLIDDVERALQSIDKADAIDGVKEGVELIHNKFTSFLSQNGVKPIEAKDQKFDTELHEAIAQMPAPTPDKKDVVIDCTQKGYTLNDKVIRFAKVVVAK